MAVRSVLLASLKSQPRLSASFLPVSITLSGFLCSPRSSNPRRPSPLPRQHFRRYVIGTSGPSQPIPSPGTPKPTSPTDSVSSASTLPPTSAAAVAKDVADHQAPRSNMTTSETVDAIVDTSANGGVGGTGVAVPGSNARSGPGPSSSGSASPAFQESKIIIEKAKRGRFRTWVVRFARSVLLIVTAGAGYLVYTGYMNRHPPDQLPHDPSKKNLVILGNGWASTAMLKSLDTNHYNVTVISPRNYFLFTPLLPSVTVGTLDARSIIEPTRFITRHKTRAVDFLEGQATDIDLKNKTITVSDNSDVPAEVGDTTIPYDYLVYNVGAANQTFGIQGVTDHACFLKESGDAEKIRTRLMDCIETATFKGQSEEEMKRLLHMVVVGGGPTGVEYAAELHDFLVEDLANWYPEIAGKVKITLVEALPNVLPMFSKQLIDYTSATFKANKIDVLTKTMVKEVKAKTIVAEDEKKNIIDIPYGLLVWATGNTPRALTKSIMAQIGDKAQSQRRGLVVDDNLRIVGCEDVWACGDATATTYAPTAQVASQQGTYLARQFEQMAKKEELQYALEEARKAPQNNSTESGLLNVEQLVKQYNRVVNLRPFSYSHQGSLAYIGSDKAIADLPFFNGNFASGGAATFLFWRSAYLSTLFSMRNRSLVVLDWLKVKVFGRDVSRE